MYSILKTMMDLGIEKLVRSFEGLTFFNVKAIFKSIRINYVRVVMVKISTGYKMFTRCSQFYSDL